MIQQIFVYTQKCHQSLKNFENVYQFQGLSNKWDFGEMINSKKNLMSNSKRSDRCVVSKRMSISIFTDERKNSLYAIILPAILPSRGLRFRENLGYGVSKQSFHYFRFHLKQTWDWALTQISWQRDKGSDIWEKQSLCHHFFQRVGNNLPATKNKKWSYFP